jgi:hypothetical protein
MTASPFEAGTLAARIYAALSPHYEGLLTFTEGSSIAGGYWYDLIGLEDESLTVKVFDNDSISVRVPVADQGAVFALLAEVVNGGGET